MGHHQENKSMSYWIPEVEEREKGAESLLREIMVENLTNLGRCLNIQVPETHPKISVQNNILHDTV